MCQDGGRMARMGSQRAKILGPDGADKDQKRANLGRKAPPESVPAMQIAVLKQAGLNKNGQSKAETDRFDRKRVQNCLAGTDCAW